MLNLRRLFVCLWVLSLPCLAALPAAAQVLRQDSNPSRISPAPEEEDLRLHVFTLEHQPAEEALELVKPMLSNRGSVELQARSNTLVVRDTLASLARIGPKVHSFDHEPQPLELEVVVLRAFSRAQGPIPENARVPTALAGKLRSLLRYESFRLVARARLQTLEGEAVSYDLNRSYRVAFRLGTVVATPNRTERLKLRDFKVERLIDGAEGGSLIHTNLNLFVGKTTTLGLARTETSDSALMVAITARPGSRLTVRELE